MIRTDGIMLAQGREPVELAEPDFCVLCQGAWSSETQTVKQLCKVIGEGLAAFSKFESLGPQKTRSRILKLGDDGIIWKTKDIIILLSFPHFLFFKSIQFSPVFSLLLLAYFRVNHSPPRLPKSWSHPSVSLCVIFIGVSELVLLLPCQDHCWDFSFQQWWWLFAPPLFSLSAVLFLLRSSQPLKQALFSLSLCTCYMNLFKQCTHWAWPCVRCLEIKRRIKIESWSLWRKMVITQITVE